MGHEEARPGVHGMQRGAGPVAAVGLSWTSFPASLDCREKGEAMASGVRLR
jgi:hypothetical protein